MVINMFFLNYRSSCRDGVKSNCNATVTEGSACGNIPFMVLVFYKILILIDCTDNEILLSLRVPRNNRLRLVRTSFLWSTPLSFL